MLLLTTEEVVLPSVPLRGIFVGHLKHPIDGNYYEDDYHILVYHGTLWGKPDPAIYTDIPILFNPHRGQDYYQDLLDGNFYPCTYEFTIAEVFDLLIEYIDFIDVGESPKNKSFKWFKNRQHETLGRTIIDISMSDENILMKQQTCIRNHCTRIQHEVDDTIIGYVADVPIWCAALTPYTLGDKCKYKAYGAVTIDESAEMTLLEILLDKLIKRDESETEDLFQQLSWLESAANRYDYNDGLVEDCYP